MTPALPLLVCAGLGREQSVPCSPGAVLQVGVVSAFAQTLRRYTSLNHLAQAARAVLQNTSQINQMLSDLNRVDFANVQVTTGSSPPHLLQKWGSTARFCAGDQRPVPSAETQLDERGDGFGVTLPGEFSVSP